MDLEHLPSILKGTLSHWLREVLPDDASVYSLIEATELLYAVILIGREWSGSTRTEIEKSDSWIPWPSLLDYESERSLEQLINGKPNEVELLGLNDLAGGTREKKGYFSVCEILFKRLTRIRRDLQIHGFPRIG